MNTADVNRRAELRAALIRQIADEAAADRIDLLEAAVELGRAGLYWDEVRGALGLPVNPHTVLVEDIDPHLGSLATGRPQWQLTIPTRNGGRTFGPHITADYVAKTMDWES